MSGPPPPPTPPPPVPVAPPVPGSEPPVPPVDAVELLVAVSPPAPELLDAALVPDVALVSVTVPHAAPVIATRGSTPRKTTGEKRIETTPSRGAEAGAVARGRQSRSVALLREGGESSGHM